jgi:2-aminobenzoylacetyl-CoA thioesterase
VNSGPAFCPMRRLDHPHHTGDEQLWSGSAAFIGQPAGSREHTLGDDLMSLERIKAQKITDHFYVLGTPFFPVYLSLGDEAMLIEGGTGGITSLIQEQLAEIGIGSEKITTMALTHSHYDHIGLVPHLKEIWKNATLLACAEISEAFGNEKVMSGFAGLDRFISEKLQNFGETNTPAPATDSAPFKIDRILAEGETIDLGSGIRWTVCKIPGHSPCQTAFFEEKERTLVVGDAAGLYFPHNNVFWPEYFLSLETYVSSVKKLASFDGERTALSHFGVVDGCSRDFLARSLQATKAYHEEMLERMKKGEALEAIALEKAKWIHTLHDYMPFEITDQMCRLLIKRSLKAAEKSPDLFSGI